MARILQDAQVRADRDERAANFVRTLLTQPPDRRTPVPEMIPIKTEETETPTAADSAAGTAASSSDARPEVTRGFGRFYDTELNCIVSEPLTLTPTMLPWTDYEKLQEENQAEVARAKAQAPQQKKSKTSCILSGHRSARPQSNSSCTRVRG